MTGATADWGGLEGRIDGRVVLPDASDFGSVRKSQMARFDAVLPAAVVLCASPADVATTVGFARHHGLPMAVRGGGHSVAGRSSTDGVIVDVGPMDGVAVEGDLVRVGAGVRLGASTTWCTLTAVPFPRAVATRSGSPASPLAVGSGSSAGGTA